MLHLLAMLLVLHLLAMLLAALLFRVRDIQLGNANITPLPLDVPAIRSSLAAIETALEREDVFQQLQADYAVLQQQLRSAEHRIADLESQFREAAQLASPFVQFCQHRYDLMRHDLHESRKQFGEVVNALAGHEGDRIRIANLESQLQTARQQHQDAIADQGRIISDLTDQLAAALLRAPTVNSQELQRLRSELDSSVAASADLQQALQQAMAARDRLQAQLASEIDDHQRTRHELAEAHDSNSALAVSQDALEGAVEQLKRQLGTAQQNITNIRIKPDSTFKIVKPNSDVRGAIEIELEVRCSLTRHTWMRLDSRSPGSSNRSPVSKLLLIISDSYGPTTIHYSQVSHWRGSYVKQPRPNVTGF
eukprot:jgi/Phyca11/20575/fgenesh1_pg.PHYCAscaffold_67_\